MKTITVNVSELVYRDFQEYARRHDRTASEIIREAMEDFRARKIRQRTSLRDLRPTSVGRVLVPFTGSEDLLEEMSGCHAG
jgi:predicted transcriptional regulator